MTYGRGFAAWRAAADNHWPAYIHHHFVAKLADGSLPRAAFLHYLEQDYVFLKHFARAWGLAVTKADTIGEMRLCAGVTQALVDEEMRMHIALCGAEGIDEAALEAVEERPANLAYTRYVLDAGHAGDFADLLAALAPCVMGYGEIGARLAREAGETPYRGWIETYGGAEYQALCEAVGGLIDGALARRLGTDFGSNPRWPGLCRRFTTATRLEAGFWEMGLAP